jgi:hypothetical protein
MLVPPPVLRGLSLSEHQKKELSTLEKDTRQRVLAVLTDEQKKTILQMEKRSFGPPGRRGDGNRGGPPDDDRGPPDLDNQPPRDRGSPIDDDQPSPPPTHDMSTSRETSPAKVGIQWFATLDSGLHEAKRSGRPILLVSAAPHCAGVSGIW